MPKEKGQPGRPRKWNSPKAMEKAIDDYFIECEGELMRDTDGTIIYNRNIQPVYINRKPPTVSGLAYYLGFASTQSLFDYSKDERFSVIITRAKLRIEAYLEERLMDRDGQRGAEFNLRCNFNWNDKDRIEEESDATGLIMMVPIREQEEETAEATETTNDSQEA